MCYLHLWWYFLKVNHNSSDVSFHCSHFPPSLSPSLSLWHHGGLFFEWESANMTIAGAADHLKSTKKYKSNAKRGSSNLRTKIKFPFCGIKPQKKDTKMCFGDMISMIISNNTTLKPCPLPSDIQFYLEGLKCLPLPLSAPLWLLKKLGTLMSCCILSGTFWDYNENPYVRWMDRWRRLNEDHF